MIPFSPGSLSEDGDGGKKQHGDKTCLICSDRAIGCNFGVVCCESCKAFFRRNAARHEEITCPFSQQCPITSRSRRFCQACRLQKCFDVGMRADWCQSSKTKRRAGERREDKKDKREAKKKDDDDDIARQIEEVLDDDSDDEVSVSKQLLKQLIRKSKKSKLLSCVCRCECGFYPPGTALTAKESQPSSTSSQPPSPASPNTPRTAMERCERKASVSHPPEKKERVERKESGPSSSSGPVPHSAAANQQPVVQSPYTQNIPIDIYLQSQQQLAWYNQNGGIPPPFSAASFGSIPPGPLPFAQSAFAPPPFLAQQLPENVYASLPRLDSSCAGPSTAGSVPTGSASAAAAPSTAIADVHKNDKLTQQQKDLLIEILTADEILKAPLELLEAKEEFTLLEVVNITHLGLRRIVLMAKQLQRFKTLQYHDQLNLIKGSCSELLILRGVSAFDPSKNIWKHNIQGIKDIAVKLEILKQTTERSHYEEHKKFLSSFPDEIRGCEQVMCTLNAIVLFSPHRPHVGDRQAVEATRQEYKGVLLRLLESLLPSPTAAREMFSQLLSLMTDLQALSHSFLNIYLGMDPRQLDPLIVELFDLPVGPAA